MKRKIIGILAAAIAVFCIACGFSLNSEITVSIDGELVEFDVKPELINNRTMVPVRAIFEHLGATVNFDDETLTVTAVKDDITVVSQIGNTIIRVNDEIREIDTPPTVKNNRTLVPVRFISESLGYNVSWDNAKRRVIISSGAFEVHFLDVGQADCTLVKSGNEVLLIDGGNRDDAALISEYLKNENIEFLDYVVCTHGHEDHVGGLTYIIETFDVGMIYANDNYSNEIYDGFFDAAYKRGIDVKEALPGDTFMVGNAYAEIIAPVMDDYADYNDSSIVLLLDYMDTEFIFTGDAGAAAEDDILAYADNIEADVLKAGHHGSSGSTTKEFLKSINPDYAVISCGAGNSYGHPHREIITLLENENIECLRTDLLGNIVMLSDGENITVDTKKMEVQKGEYIGNKKSRKVHSPDCGGLPAENNRIYFKTVAQAISAGYEKCGRCNPE